MRVQLRRCSRSQVSRPWQLQTGRSSARPAGSLPRRPSCWWSMPSCQHTRVAGRSAPVRCAGAAQLLVVHAQLLVGMPIRVFSLSTVCVLSSMLFRGPGDVLHSRQRCPLIPLTGVSTYFCALWRTASLEFHARATRVTPDESRDRPAHRAQPHRGAQTRA